MFSNVTLITVIDFFCMLRNLPSMVNYSAKLNNSLLGFLAFLDKQTDKVYNIILNRYQNRLLLATVDCRIWLCINLLKFELDSQLPWFGSEVHVFLLVSIMSWIYSLLQVCINTMRLIVFNLVKSVSYTPHWNNLPIYRHTPSYHTATATTIIVFHSICEG